MRRKYVCFIRDVFFHEQFDRIMGETRTSIKQRIPHTPSDPFIVLSLIIDKDNTASKVYGRQREHLNPDDTDVIVKTIDHKTFLFLCDLCVKSGIMKHD